MFKQKETEQEQEICILETHYQQSAPELPQFPAEQAQRLQRLLPGESPQLQLLPGVLPHLQR